MCIRDRCDSLVILNLTVKDTSFVQLDTSICFGETFVFDNQNLTQTGNYFATFQNVNQCDSLVILNLTVKDTSFVQLDTSICFGETFVFDNQDLTQTGNYFATFQNVNQCDSLVILNLTVKDTSLTNLNAEICEGESITFNNQALTTTGFYFQTLQNVNQCDSLIILNLIVKDCGAQCSENHLILNDTPIQKGIYQAMDTITSSGVIATDTVTFLAGKTILLQPGFHALANSYFTAKIQVCPTNVVADTDNVTFRTQSLLCLLYTSPSPRDRTRSRMPSSA